MSVLQAMFLGLIQGIAEFLPISSSGHLSILQNLFQMNTAEEGHLFFDVLLHLGTLASVCIVFWKDIKEMALELVGFFRGLRHPQPELAKPAPARRLLIMVIVSILPLFLILPIKKYVEGLYYSTIFIGIALILTGCMLFVSDKMVVGRKTEKSITLKNTLFIGLCQAIAVVPGLSRSGTTITAGLSCGFTREFSVKFSFLISVPAILGANLVSLISTIKDGIDLSYLPAYLVGMVVATVVGIVAIKLVKMLMDKGKFGKFAYYCWAVGLLTIILSLIL